MTLQSGAAHPAVVAALRSLAALIRAGLPMTTAITAWPDHCPAEIRAPARACARRITLGADAAGALEAMSPVLGRDAAIVLAIADLHARSGCDAPRLLEAAARAIDRRSALTKNAAIATAGTKLSGKIVGALPLMVLPLVPAAGATLFDRRGMLLLLSGAALLLTGAWWISRLLPRPPHDDEAGALAALVAAALHAGVGVDAALRLCNRAAGLSLLPELQTCQRRVRLAADWGAALELSSDGGLRELGGVLRRAERIGAPVARSLELFAAERYAGAEAAFDRATRRAPVLMVVPLTICILPAYVLLAIGPLLRGLSFS